MQRRDFLKGGVVCWSGLWLSGSTRAASSSTGPSAPDGAVVISTWDFGEAANGTAYRVLEAGGSVVDAVQQGVMVVEDDPEVTSVGYGGLPNVDGVVELDAAIVDGATREAGSVAGLRDIRNPVAVARKVMDETPHVLLVGDGARRFALAHGFETQNLLTPSSRKRWKKAKASGFVEDDSHDTIGMVALDGRGGMAAACTTSGMAWKLPGRVGDSPLVGHGLYCDAAAGGAVATGLGEEIVKVCGSYQVVEFMRQGLEPDEAIRSVLRRVVDRDPQNRGRMVAFAALRADGRVGYGSTKAGFKVAITRRGTHEVMSSPSLASSTSTG
jgi:L-asparaginase/N4-(beta-N-acetylglucosaminyl)-L-asparaginase